MLITCEHSQWTPPSLQLIWNTHKISSEIYNFAIKDIIKDLNASISIIANKTLHHKFLHFILRIPYVLPTYFYDFITKLQACSHNYGHGQIACIYNCSTQKLITPQLRLYWVTYSFLQMPADFSSFWKSTKKGGGPQVLKLWLKLC